MSRPAVSPIPAAAPITPQISLVLSAVFLVFLAHTTIAPIIAPLSREVGLAEWQIGLTISASASMVVVTSQFWGRRSQSWGRKPVLTAAFAVATTTMAMFALFAYLGMAGAVTGTALFVLFVVLRGLGFGTAMAAVPPTAQAYIADVTHDAATRIKGMAGVGAVQGIAMIGGAVVGGVLAAFGLLIPLLVVPVLLATALVLVVFRLRPEARTTLIKSPARIRPADRRVLPFLLAGFGMFTALGFIQVVTGFIVQDRLGLDGEMTGLVTGGTLLAAGIGMSFSQSVIVPRSGWSPPALLRIGTPVSLLGFLLIIPDAGLALLLLAILLLGLGLGIAVPGYTAGPSLLVHRNEQGSLAGLISATNGLTFVVAPTASTALYSIWPPLPIIVGAAVMACVVILVLLHPRFRHFTPVIELGVAQRPASVLDTPTSSHAAVEHDVDPDVEPAGSAEHR